MLHPTALPLKGQGRPPRGGRGLKSLIRSLVFFSVLSPPSRGAWIEMSIAQQVENHGQSPPSRGAWIEIPFKAVDRVDHQVAPLAGGVD